MRLGLATRILIAGGIVLAFLVVAFLMVMRSFRVIAKQTDAAEQSQKALVAAAAVEKLVLDLETGTRGYVITRDERFLEPVAFARVTLPVRSRQLRQAEPTRETAAIEAAWRSYLEEWVNPLVAQVKESGAAAEARIASGGGKRRVDRIRGMIDPFVKDRLAAVEGDRQRVDAAEREGKLVGMSGIGVTLLLFLGMVVYFGRTTVAPLRRIALATERVAEGGPGGTVPESGAGEVGRLGRAFNEMSTSLLRQQHSLAEQNVDLERLANVLRAVLDSTVDGILLSDAEGNVQLANRPIIALTRDLGMSFEGPVVDRLLSVADRMQDPAAYRAAMEKLRANPDEPTFDEFEDAASGRVFQGFTAPVLDDRGGFLGRIWTLREVTQQRELDRLKDEFVATVSHELRTPLTSMMGFLEMIREGEAGELTDEQQRFLAIVHRSSERLQRLVGDLLFVARLDASGLQLQFGQVDVRDVVAETLESTAALARSRGIEQRGDLSSVPAVFGDRERLSQLVSNLVSNALKFTPQGGTVTARTFSANGTVAVEVEDTGIGIPAAEQGRLFQRFFRSSTATEQAIPGTGLGLVISKAIAEAHGGGITVSSEPGEGTCFRVELPVAED